MKILLRCFFAKVFIIGLVFSCAYESLAYSGLDVSSSLSTVISAPVYVGVFIEANDQVVVTGRADPFSQVDLVGGSKLLGEAFANQTGDFKVSLSKKLKSGEYRYVLRSTNKAGRSATSVQTLIVNVSDEETTWLTAIVEEPGGSQRIIYPLINVSGDDGKTEKNIFGVEYIFYGNGHFIVCGHAPANRRAAIYYLDLILGSEFIKKQGRFCIERTNKLSEGTYAFKAQLLDEKGEVSANVTLPFTVSNINKGNEQYYIANKPVETVVVRPGETLSQIAQRVYGDYNLANQIYQLNRHILDNVHNIEAGQRLALPSKQ